MAFICSNGMRKSSSGPVADDDEGGTASDSDLEVRLCFNIILIIYITLSCTVIPGRL